MNILQTGSGLVVIYWIDTDGVWHYSNVFKMLLTGSGVIVMYWIYYIQGMA